MGKWIDKLRGKNESEMDSALADAKWAADLAKKTQPSDTLTSFPSPGGRTKIFSSSSAKPMTEQQIAQFEKKHLGKGSEADVDAALQEAGQSEEAISRTTIRGPGS